MAALNLTKRNVDVLDSNGGITSASATSSAAAAVAASWDMERNLALQAMHAALVQQQWLGGDHQLLQQQQQQQQQQQFLQASLLQQSLASVGMWATQTPGLPSVPLSLVQQSTTDLLRAELEKRLASFLAEVGSNFTTPGPSSASSTHSLRRDGHCEWPQCAVPIENNAAMLDHLQQSHSLSADTLAAAQLQLAITRHLEQRAADEAYRLSAMLMHLRDLTPAQSQNTTQSSFRRESPVFINGLFNGTSGSSPSPGPIHRFRSIDTKVSPIMSTHGLGLSCNDLTKNRSFYRQSTDVRPPFTYAALIRQSILESSQRQLTLNEIYQWFQSEFAYFRRNEATWKNAVRHNLSLHKCFMRVENVKGAVWTVDEGEFLRRRPQRLGGSSGGVTSSSSRIKEEPSVFSSMAAAAAVESQAQLLAAQAAGNLTSGGVLTHPQQHSHCTSPLESGTTSPDSSGAPDFRSLQCAADGFQLPTSCSPGEVNQTEQSFCGAHATPDTLWNVPLSTLTDEVLLSHPSC